MGPSKILSRGVLHILVDSKSLSERYTDSPKSLNFLRYDYCDFFDIKRTPYETGLEIIDSLPTFRSNAEVSKNKGSMEHTTKKIPVCVAVALACSDYIEPATKEFLQKQTIDKDDRDKFQNVLAYANLCQYYESVIYITSDDVVLQNRYWPSTDPLYEPANIVTVEEGREIMDIFAKNLGNYFIKPGRQLDMNHYYKISFISKIPHHLSPTGSFISDTDTIPLDALAERFIWLLKCVDKIGIAYYSGVTIDVINEIRFYFNYFIILAAGILDSLAAETKKKYKIDVDNKWAASEISLSNKAGKKLAKIIKEKDRDIYRHIKSNIELINLIYLFRNPAVHGNFRAPEDHTNLFDVLGRVDPNIKQALSSLKNEKSRYNEYSNWGLIKRSGAEYVLTYVFSKKLTSSLIDFVDIYLKKLELTGHKIEFMNDSLTVRQFQAERLCL